MLKPALVQIPSLHGTVRVQQPIPVDLRVRAHPMAQSPDTQCRMGDDALLGHTACWLGCVSIDVMHS